MRTRNIIASCVLAGSVFASIIIIALPHEKTSTDSTATTAGAGPEKNSNLSFSNANTEVSPTISNASPANSLQEITNLTDKLAESYLQSIAKNNPQGVTNPNGNAQIKIPNTISLDDQTLSQTFSDTFNPRVFNANDIRISADNSPATQLSYLESVDAATTQNFKSSDNIAIVLKNFFEKNDATGLQNRVTQITLYINDLLKITVPSQFSTLHIQLLNLWSKKIPVYQAILNSQTDPLRGYLAMKQIDPLLQEDTNLQLVLIKRYQELKS